MKFHDSNFFEKFNNRDATGAIQILGMLPSFIG
jgi:hypothetical protein